MRNKIFEKIPITLPQRSGFDLSHENSGTGKPGLLIPVFTRECEGRDSLSVNLAQQIQFPPFATDFYGRIKVYFEAFFVPYRIMYAGYKRMYEQALDPFGSHGESNVGAGVNKYWPGLIARNDSSIGFDDSYPHGHAIGGFTMRGSLLDYLGVKDNVAFDRYDSRAIRLNNLNRLLAYHKIFDEYYRDSRIEARCFSEPYGLNTSGITQIWALPYMMLPAGNQYFFDSGLESSLLANGHNILGFHSRPYAKDYFTMATPDPQFGNEFGVSADTDGVITISQIRAANALQQFAELYNRVGLHYDDLAFAQTGIRPSDAAVDIPVYLGRLVYDVYNKSVFQQNNSEINEFRPNTQNPFISVGSKFANGQSVGSGHLCDFTATEGGIFMVLMSVAPDAVYSSGTARQWKYSSLIEMPKAQLAGIGDQPIYEGELVNAFVADDSTDNIATPFDDNRIFGYTQRFAEAKFMLDECHGELREFGALSSFQLKRYFEEDNLQGINSAFLRVNSNCLDEVSAVYSSELDAQPSPISPFYWFDLYFETKLVSNLPAYSLPTLENMHGPTAMVDNGGRRL